MAKEITIGLFGYGCVGQGLYNVLQNSKRFKAEIKKIVIKHPEKKRNLSADFFSVDKNDILSNSSINTVVELIDDADEAYHIVKAALLSGKNVVTANKKMLAFHLPELIQIQKEKNVSLLYEASACGGIPIIRTLEEYYDNEYLSSVRGIFNGSSNFILSKIYSENVSYPAALKEAQDLGFAESNPRLDVGGYDAKFKLIILALHAFGISLNPTDVLNLGIENFSTTEVSLFNHFGYKVRLVPQVKQISDTEVIAFTLPEIVSKLDQLYHVNKEFNAVEVAAAYSDQQSFIGKGAGGNPTGSAVLSDLSALSFDYKYEYKKVNLNKQLSLNNDFELPIYASGDAKKLRQIFGIKNEGKLIVNKSISWLLSNQATIDELGIFIAHFDESLFTTINTFVKSKTSIQNTVFSKDFGVFSS